jgi:glycosyltransferase involved in cell wall biosynthesis
MRILWLTNMGPQPQAPFDLAFLKRQYQSCRQHQPQEQQKHHYTLHSMTWNGNSLHHRLFKYPRWSYRFIRDYCLGGDKIDLIHIHFFYPTALLAILYKKWVNNNVKLLVNFHGSDIYKYPKPGKLYRWALSQIDGINFASEGLQQRFSLGSDKPQWLIPIGIDSAFITNLTQKQQQKCYDLTFAGRLDHNKGIKRLVNALTTIRQPLHVAVIGNGEHNQWVNDHWPAQHRLTRFNRLDSHDLAKIYGQSRFVINCSYFESYGMVIAEALACGTPVIASVSDGSKKLLNHKNGFIINNPEQSDSQQNFSAAAADTITTALKLTPAQYQQYQHHASHSSPIISATTAAEKFSQIYQQLYEKKREGEGQE